MKLVCLTISILWIGMISAEDKPNVLFISIDDLNDWVGCLGGHPQARTPNIDRLAKEGVLFNNAHCPAPACNPSRSAIFSGISPHVSGLYSNNQKMRAVLPDSVLIPKHFSNNGYWSGGSGKMLHYFIDAQSWDLYYPEKSTENPFPPRMSFGKRPKSLPHAGEPWMYGETDWGSFDVTDQEFGGDYNVAEWVSNELLKPDRDKPFFLACGIYRPHEPWFVPKKYFDLFPIESIQLPPGYRKDDLKDLPPEGKRRGPNRYLAHIQKHDQWREGIQGYLASIAFADAMLGRVLDALDKSPHKSNTVVVLWSDHGWHLGEKQHWQKFTAWRAVTRVPLIIKAPGLEGNGETCSRPVNLLDLYPTLVDLCDLPEKKVLTGRSLVPLLKDPSLEWNHPSYTFLESPKNYGLSLQEYRYIHYSNGGEELYHIPSDPYELTNLALLPEHQDTLKAVREQAPPSFAPLKRALPEPKKDAQLTLVKGSKDIPNSKKGGREIAVIFQNETNNPIGLHWVDFKGGRKSFGKVQPGKERRIETKDGHVWEIKSDDSLLGYFITDWRSAYAAIKE